jgi:outer membrane protein TolC
LSASAGIRLSLQAGVGETLRQTELEKNRTETVRLDAEASVVRAVKTSYYAIATEQRRLELYGKNLELAQREAAMVQKNYNAGLASELSLLQAQYAAASLEPDLLQARQEFAQTLRAFNILLGIDPDTSVVFTDTLDHNFPDVCLPGDVPERIELRADVTTARIARDAAVSRRRAGTLNRYAPSVTLSESAGVSDLQDGFSAPETGTFTLSVAIPLNGYIPGSETRIDAKELDAAVEKAEIALKDARTEAREEIRSLFDTLNRLQKSIEITRLNETVAVRAYELSREGYESGLVALTDLDEARQKSLEARFSMLNAVYLYKAALIELAYALTIEESELCVPGE